ncbi:UNVERIFIED_CONTAM: Exocyst complex component EXO70A1 [Sesamum calycinum]|uniref:Exocyst subunit Exo70 family protein n=1 Tax=Sesamum calycinum TaxID=2727403 RepID=A0AAW2N0S8_9LAMI
MGAYAGTIETLTERAALMKESMQKTQAITDNMAAILGSFDHRLSALETAMRPTQALLFFQLLSLKTHSIRRAHENIDKTLKSAEGILSQFDLSRKAEAKLLRGPHEDLESYLEAVDQLRSIVRFFSGKKGIKSSIGVVNHASNLIGKAIVKLEEELRQLLALYSKPVEPDRLFDCLPNSMRPSSGSPREGESNGKKASEQQNKETVVYQLPTLIPAKLLPLLHEIAEQMIQAGHQQTVVNIYREARSSALEQTLRKLGVERLGKEDVQKMQWEVLEAKIGNWIHYMRIAVKLLFAGEKKVCDEIFVGHDILRDQCFADVTANSVSVLLSFGEAIAKSKRSPEKLFVLLDMYEIMRELQSEIDIIFGSKFCGEMRESSVNLTKRLAQTASGNLLVILRKAVEKDATKTAVLDGTVHPLTSYVINYVKFLFDYHSTLQQLFREFDDGDAEKHLASITTRIMQALQSNLDGKSKQYKDPALTQLFLMNNVHYIILQCLSIQGASQPSDVAGVSRQRPMIEGGKNPQKYIRYTPEDLERMLAEFLKERRGTNQGDRFL